MCNTPAGSLPSLRKRSSPARDALAPCGISLQRLSKSKVPMSGSKEVEATTSKTLFKDKALLSTETKAEDASASFSVSLILRARLLLQLATFFSVHFCLHDPILCRIDVVKVGRRVRPVAPYRDAHTVRKIPGGGDLA